MVDICGYELPTNLQNFTQKRGLLLLKHPVGYSTWRQRLLIAGDGHDGHASVNHVYDRSLDVTPQTTEQSLIVRTAKYEAEVTNNKRLQSMYCTVEANYRLTRNIARPLCNSRASCLVC